MLTVQNVPEHGGWKALRIPVDACTINMLSFSVALAPLGAERCCLLSSGCWLTDIHDQMKPRQESRLIKKKSCLQHVLRNVGRAKTALAEWSQGLCNYPAEVEISDKNRNLIENLSPKCSSFFLEAILIWTLKAITFWPLGFISSLQPSMKQIFHSWVFWWLL